MLKQTNTIAVYHCSEVISLHRLAKLCIVKITVLLTIMCCALRWSTLKKLERWILQCYRNSIWLDHITRTQKHKSYQTLTTVKVSKVQTVLQRFVHLNVTDSVIKTGLLWRQPGSISYNARILSRNATRKIARMFCQNVQANLKQKQRISQQNMGTNYINK